MPGLSGGGLQLESQEAQHGDADGAKSNVLHLLDESCSTLCFPDKMDYPEAGQRDSFGLANLRMNAPEDHGDVSDCSPLDDGDSGVQGVAEPVPRR